MVGGEASCRPEVKSRGWIHLHQECLVLLLPLLGELQLQEHEISRASVNQHGKARHGVTPGDVVEVGVEEPATVPAASTEENQTQEDQDCCDDLHGKGQNYQVVLEP